MSDPVLERRERIRRLTGLGQRLGYLAFGAAMAVFFLALATGFTSALVTVIVALLVAGSMILAPAIVFAYAVRAADAEDRSG